MKRWNWITSASLLLALLVGGCAALDEQQRQWIFRPSDRSWGNSADLARGMQDIWIDFRSSVTDEPARLHGLWLGAEPTSTDTPVLLYLHGAGFNVDGSAPRMRRMHELGFSVLAIDYRGFGKSSPGLPSEASADEDALAAWTWLAARHPQQRRYIFGHSLGGAIGINLAAHVKDASGTIVEGTFSSMADLASSFKWGWLPFGPFLTQRFDALAQVKSIGAPLLVVHGSADHLINPALGRKLYEAATVPKMFVLVEGGSHYTTNSVGETQYRAALAQLFRMKPVRALAAVEGTLPAKPEAAPTLEIRALRQADSPFATPAI